MLFYITYMLPAPRLCTECVKGEIPTPGWSSAKPRSHLNPPKSSQISLLGTISDALASPNPLEPAACCRSWLKSLKALGGILWYDDLHHVRSFLEKIKDKI